MSIKVVRQALETKIKEFAIANGNIPVANEDVKFDPNGKALWLKTVLFQSDTLNPCLGDNMSRQVGFLQISVCVPEGSGVTLAESICDKLVEAFPRGTEILREGTYVQIPKTMYSQQPFTLNGVRMYPMVMRYTLDNF